MAELLFIATIIFVAYVMFVVVGEKKENPESRKSEVLKPEIPTSQKIDLPPEPEISVAKPESVKTSQVKSASTKPSKAKSASNKATAPVVEPIVNADSLKNPKTGEVAKIPNSYTFAKRWIKDALVEEGLLDKIYKNNELDDPTNAKIQDAFQKLLAMDKYH